MATQLRVFTIKPGKMKEWNAGWTRGVAPLRLKWGFSIPGAWVLEEANQFFWLLRYDGPEGFEARDAAYYASEDRKSLDPDPAQYIAKQETRFVTAVWPP